MGFSTGRRVISFLLPGGLLFLGTLIAVRYPAFLHWSEPLAGLFAAAALVSALLLGWRFDRSRLVFAAVIVAIAGWVHGHFGIPYGHLLEQVTEAVAILLPINIALLALLKERGIFTWHGSVRWAFVLAQLLAVWGLFHYQQYQWLDLLDTRIISLKQVPDFSLGQPALLAFAIGLTVTGYRGLRHHSAMDNGLFWALALMLYALLVPAAPQTITNLFTSTLLILILAVLEVSYSMAFHDELTGLPGRRALNQALLKLGGRYTIAMLDVDHFKKFNDSYGHDVGDEVLKMVAARLSRVTGGGKAYRYGGEEFTVLYPGKSMEATLHHLEQLRETIASSPFTVRGKGRRRKKGAKPGKGSNRTVNITVSAGVAEREGSGRNPQAVIKAADKALYRAKTGGRNRVAS
ncbi:GGDEF domain-containing protein [Thiohalomonas denitrificans]|uniref:GGDEF domain-containing protein n=1 Tax=Thiohalomonas denitrificans TaxID=415747 RepID=UPI0026EC26C5|nr:GGDEF domain-containing protein [Thiohalomonas denitrificans]